MYLGKIVESADRERIFRNPMHPYTKALFSSVPVPDPEATMARMIIKGEIPSAISPPPGCTFNPRCPFVFDRCRNEIPELIERDKGHFVSCHLHFERK